MTADTPAELHIAADHVGAEVDRCIARLDIRSRGILVSMGVIELSRREFVRKLEEIAVNGEGLGPKSYQIDR